MKAIIFALCCLSFSAFAVDSVKASVEPDIDGLIKTNLGKLGLTASSIADSPVDGLYQVITDRGLFYFSDNGQFLVHGKVYDLKNGVENISELALAQVRIDGVKQFEDSMIVYPAKNEKHKVTVFTDTTCGYCRKLHSQMAEYNELGITVQYLAFPRSGVTGPTFKELNAIWCAADKEKALTDVKNGTKMDMAKAKMCDAPIAEQYAMGMQVGVSGTPAIIFDNGSMIPGYQPPAQLFAALEDAKVSAAK
ncbi:MAG: thiol:disulfide interchange protein DsbC [Phenylobacterium sp.]|jgi:thiol:disulfide interchange protein DsbC